MTITFGQTPTPEEGDLALFELASLHTVEPWGS
jgi:hypothetical protein